MLIGELSKKSGISRDSIRFYEKLGLIRVGFRDRRANNYKEYPPETLSRLQTIKNLKHFGFTLNEASDLLALMDLNESPCVGLPDKLSDKIAMLDEKIKQMIEIKIRLEWVKSICTGDCAAMPDMPECFAEQDCKSC